VPDPEPETDDLFIVAQVPPGDDAETLLADFFPEGTTPEDLGFAELIRQIGIRAADPTQRQTIDTSGTVETPGQISTFFITFQIDSRLTWERVTTGLDEVVGGQALLEEALRGAFDQFIAEDLRIGRFQVLLNGDRLNAGFQTLPLLGYLTIGLVDIRRGRGGFPGSG
jgi:hypothetical protein